MFDNEDWKLESNGQKIIIQTAISRKFIFRCDSNPYNIALTKHITNLHNNRDKFNVVGEETTINYSKKHERPKIEKLEPIVKSNGKLFNSRLLGILVGR